MTRRGRKHTSYVVPLLAALPFALAGCGGGGSSDASATDAATHTTTVTKTVTAPAPTTPASPTTPTAPAAAPKPNAPLSLQAAEQVLEQRGYAPLTERDFRPDQQLKVLIGIKHGNAPRAEQAFFFVGDRFIGTDTKDPSGQITVTDQSDDAVTLEYGLYKPGDPIDSPSGGTAQVTYRWNGSALTPQGTIPSAAADASPSRR